jgi:3-dehydroquinate synthase
MVLAARYSARRGELSHDDAERTARAIAAAGLPSKIASFGMDCTGETLVDHMRHDKKMEGSGTLPFLLLRGIGEAYMARDVELADVAAFLDEQMQAH